MLFKKEEAYQNALCMDLTPERFQLSIIDRKQKKILHFEEFEVEEFSRDFVKSILTNDILKHDFGTFSLSAGSERNTLIPFELFSHARPDEIFKLNYPEPIDNLDYNRISEMGIVNIYEIPLWIKSLFVIKFPRIKIIHRSTVLLKGVFDKHIFSPKIHLHIENHQFYMWITDKAKLVYFNRFDYKELADLVYYVLFVLEQKEFDQTKFELLLYGLSQDWELLKTFQNYFDAKVKIAVKKEESENFMLAKQLLCV